MKIAHFGTFDVPNFGDLLFPLTLERRLAELDVEWVHTSPRGGAAVWGDCVSTVSVESLVTNPSDLTALVVGGGNIINCSPTTLPDYDLGGLSAVLAYPRLWIEPAHLAARLDLPLWWNAPGVSEPFSRNGARLARWATSITGHLAVRDRTSETWLREAGVESPLSVVPDTALEVSRLWSEPELAAAYAEAFARRDRREPERSVALHVNERFAREAPEIIAGRLDRICQRARATGILIAMGPCHGDSALQRAVGEKMATGPLVIDQPQSLREIVACIARSEAYVGSSLHGVITACSFGRKCMAVVSPEAATRHKFTGFLEMFQLASWLCDSWAQAEERMDGLISASAEPWRRVPELSRPMLEAHWEGVRELLRAAGRKGRSRRKPSENRESLALLNRMTGSNEACSGPIQLIIREQAARAVEVSREAKRTARKAAQLSQAWEESRRALSVSEETVRRAEERQSLVLEQHEEFRRESESRWLSLNREQAQTLAALETLKGRVREAEAELAGLLGERELRQDDQARMAALDQALEQTRTEFTQAVEKLRHTEQALAATREQHELRQRESETCVRELTRASAVLHGSLDAARAERQKAELELVHIREKAARQEGELRQRIRELEEAGKKTEAIRTAVEERWQRERREAALKHRELERHARELEDRNAELTTRLDAARKAQSTARARFEKASKSADYARLVLRVRDAVGGVIPAGSTVAVVSKGDPDLLKLGGRNAWHFPRDERGEYAGYHPADGAAVLAQLESQQSDGADFLVVPRTAFWWFDHYGELRRHLDSCASCLWRDENCAIFRLASRGFKDRVQQLARWVGAGFRWEVSQGRSAGRVKPRGEPLEADGLNRPAMEARMDEKTYARVVLDVRAAVDRWVPAEAVVAVISKGDDELLRFTRNRGWHFPQTDQGVYAGHHPGSDSDAMDHLEALRLKGVSWLVIPKTAWWWLDHYREFGRHLRCRYRCIGGNESCVLFDLSSRPANDRFRRVRGLVAAGVGLLRKRHADGVTGNAPTPESPPAAVAAPSERPDSPLKPGLVTVVVPVYNAAEEVRSCLESLLRHTPHPHQVLLIDDCSPDPSIRPILESYARKHAHVHFKANAVNLGFTGTVNLGCRLAPGDVVLLNSDTQVTRGWLEKLAACAASRDNVATVTPLSNAAGAFSVPDNHRVNEIPPALTIEDLGKLVEDLSRRLRPEVPTGNGFCLYVTRRALNLVGGFDEEHFPRGYGEENDFCMRARARGLVNLIDDATFIYHRQSASFLDQRSELLARSRETLRRLHPTYKRDVTEWLSHDPLDGLRDELRARLRAQVASPTVVPGPACLLFVIHEGMGGTLLTNADLVRELAEYRRLVLKTGLNHWTLLEFRDGEFQCVRRYSFSSQWQVRTSLDGERLRVLEDICDAFQVRLAHVRHLLGNGPEALDTFHRLGIPVVLSFHDYYTVCPTIQLIDGNGVFCGGRCTPGSEECGVARSWFRGGMPVLKHQYVHEHRRRMTAALEGCKCFITTCSSAREILRDSFPSLRDADFRVIEHGRELPRAQLATLPRTDVPARVICLGNIDRAKGGQLIEKLMVMDRQLGSRFEFHFLGNQASTFKPRSLGGICHGPYERDELVEILRKIAPSFSLIASIWPETYCHTLTESWAAGLPVFASNLGALRERIELHGGGWLLDPRDPEGWYHAMVEVLQSPSACQRAVAEVAAYRPRPIKRMADDYRQIYAACLNGKETVR